MKKRAEGLSKNIASSRNWFRSELLPDDIKLQRQVLEKGTTIQCYEGIKLLFVEGGSGTLFANGKSYPLHQGSCCLIYCFHFHKVIPDSGQTLEVSTCYISYNTFLFASIVPGYHLLEIEQSLIPILANFSNAQQLRIRQILASMEESQNNPNNALQHALLFEWLGRLCRVYSQK